MALAMAGTVARQEPARRDRVRSVRIWLFCLAGLVMLMVAVGGATRLTGSGLSITEWRPVTGAIPPLSDAAWQAEFGKYRASPQYEILNQGMTLAEFKTIYAWEWGHRQLGRLIGLAFFGPFLWFWWVGAVRGRLAATLLGIGTLGGLQAMVGWIMVASGLQPGMIAVAPIKLMLHLLLAGAILSALLWVAVGLRSAALSPQERRGARGARLLLGLVFMQIALGGLVAGSRAGFTYNTWPLLDGRLIPPAGELFVRPVFLENLVDNPLLVQFDHRIMAYLLAGYALWHALRLRRNDPASPASRRATAVVGLILAQMGLGIATVLLVVPLWAGLAHQLLAMTILAMASVHARLATMAEA